MHTVGAFCRRIISGAKQARIPGRLLSKYYCFRMAMFNAYLSSVLRTQGVTSSFHFRYNAG